MPSATPVATASTFFIAPPSSAPAMSLPVYARNVGACSICATLFANAASAECTVSAVGSPSATSRANDGPVTTAAACCGKRSATSSCRKRPETGSKPFVAHATPTCGAIHGFAASRISENA